MLAGLALMFAIGIIQRDAGEKCAGSAMNLSAAASPCAARSSGPTHSVVMPNCSQSAKAVAVSPAEKMRATSAIG